MEISESIKSASKDIPETSEIDKKSTETIESTESKGKVEEEVKVEEVVKVAEETESLEVKVDSPIDIGTAGQTEDEILSISSQDDEIHPKDAHDIEEEEKANLVENTKSPVRMSDDEDDIVEMQIVETSSSSDSDMEISHSEAPVTINNNTPLVLTETL